jgi:thiamine pyrophosphokinase
MNIPPDVAQATDLWLIGPLARAPLPAQAMARKMPQIAIDGGVEVAVQPCLWIGDADSGRAPRDGAAFFKPAQDQTDLEYALGILRPCLWQRLHLSGFSGGRADHFLGNVGAIDTEMRRRDRFRHAVFYGDAGEVLLHYFAAGAHCFFYEGVFSLFALSPAVVSISGACAYPANGLGLPPLSGRGLSNVARGDVRIEADVPVFVMFPSGD